MLVTSLKVPDAVQADKDVVLQTDNEVATLMSFEKKITILFLRDMDLGGIRAGQSSIFSSSLRGQFDAVSVAAEVKTQGFSLFLLNKV